MAEVRKVTPGRGGAIAAAIEKVMGESVRPVTPGGSPDPSRPQSVPRAAETPITASSLLMTNPFLFPQAGEAEDAVEAEEAAEAEDVEHVAESGQSADAAGSDSAHDGD